MLWELDQATLSNLGTPWSPCAGTRQLSHFFLEYLFVICCIWKLIYHGKGLLELLAGYAQ